MNLNDELLILNHEIMAMEVFNIEPEKIRVSREFHDLLLKNANMRMTGESPFDKITEIRGVPVVIDEMVKTYILSYKNEGIS